MDKEYNNELFPEGEKPEQTPVTEPEIKNDDANAEIFLGKEDPKPSNDEADAEIFLGKEDPKPLNNGETVKPAVEENTASPAGGIRSTYVPDASNMSTPQRPTYSYTSATNPGINRDNSGPYRRPVYNANPGAPRPPYTGPNAAPNAGYNNPYQQRPAPASDPKEAPKKQKNRITGKMVILMLVFSFVFSGAWSTLFYLGENLLSPVVENGTIISSKAKKDNEPLNSKESGVVVDQNAEGVAAAVNVAADSVVEIQTEVVTTSFFYGEYIQSGAGSGVIIDAGNGYIITCAHVITGASNVTVTLRSGDKYDAEIIGSDTQTDIAVIKIEAEGLVAAATYDSDKLVVGQTAIAIGNPLGTLGGTVSSGIVSALDREITIDGQEYNLLQIDTSINPGNSGGGLFDIAGNLIGIVNAKSGGADGGTTIEGLGFAIPINKALEVADDLISQGYVGGRVYLGISVAEITESTTQVDPNLYDYIYGTGVYFVGYQTGQKGDFLYGDKIIAIDGSEVSTRAEILSILNDYSVGDSVTVTVSRLNSDMGRRKMVDVEVKLIESVPEEG